MLFVLELQSCMLWPRDGGHYVCRNCHSLCVDVNSGYPMTYVSDAIGLEIGHLINFEECSEH